MLLEELVSDRKVNKSNKVIKDRNVPSLFSGAGGMDLGFEGGFEVLTKSLNKSINPHWSTEEVDNV